MPLPRSYSCKVGVLQVGDGNGARGQAGHAGAGDLCVLFRTEDEYTVAVAVDCSAETERLCVSGLTFHERCGNSAPRPLEFTVILLFDCF